MKLAPAALLLVGSAHSAGLAAACFPDQDYSVAAEYGQSVTVVVGTVTGEQHLPEPDAWNPDATLYQLRVRETFKGSPGKNISIWSENSSGRFPMAVGSSYLLFLYSDGTHLIVDNCGNSGLVSRTRQVRAVLEELRTRP